MENNYNKNKLGEINFKNNSISSLLCQSLYTFQKNEDGSIIIYDNQGFVVNKKSIKEVIKGFEIFLLDESTDEEIADFNLSLINNRLKKESVKEIIKKKISGYVYFMECNGKIKIGRTKEPNKRLKVYGVNSPFETNLIHIIKTKDSFLLEKEMHELFFNKRVNGEWFELTKEDIKNIQDGLYDGK